MPKVFEWQGWAFLFYSLDRCEPPHVHVMKDRKECKIWLANLAVAKNRRCSEQELNAILAVVRERQQDILEKWHEHFGN
nr:DUF4160 domain-containing protein [uncultured Gellertiella sp.]